jgi:hypothetical protein
LRAAVKERASQRCEYCRLPDNRSRFHVEHIIAIQHKGMTELDNLAWACLQCNAAKGPNVASYDSDTSDLTPLFHPRKQIWDEHFNLVEGEIFGKTAVGRVTSELLDFNASERVELRRALIAVGEW